MSQAAEWVYDPLQQEEGEVQKGWILLEEEERWENHAGGSHEAQSAGSRGERLFPISNTIQSQTLQKTSGKHIRFVCASGFRVMRLIGSTGIVPVHTRH